MWALANSLSGKGPASTAAVAEAVRVHLEGLLATRQSQAPAARAYGVAGGAERLTALLERWPHSKAQIEGALMDAIKAFEHRLTALRWAAAPNLGPQGLHLTLVAQLVPTGAPLVFVLVVSPRGQVEVRV